MSFLRLILPNGDSFVALSLAIAEFNSLAEQSDDDIVQGLLRQRSSPTCVFLQCTAGQFRVIRAVLPAVRIDSQGRVRLEGELVVRDALERPSAIGDVVCLVVREAVSAQVAVVGVVGLLPWFRSRIGRLWDALLFNTDPVPHDWQRAVGKLVAPTPLFPLTEAPGEAPSMSAVLSFALRWHMIDSARSRVGSVDERANVLDMRSARFFGVEAPRVALLGRASGWRAVVQTLRKLRQQRSIDFVVAQLCAAVAFVGKTEFEAKHRLEFLLTDVLAPLANHTAAAVAPHLRPTTGCDLSLDVRTVGELRDAGELTNDDVRRLGGAADEDKACVSYLFGAFPPLEEALTADDESTLATHAVLKRGRVYLCDSGTLVQQCVSVVGGVLKLHARAVDDRSADESRCEALLLRAMPNDTRRYATDRAKDLDDVAIRSSAYVALMRAGRISQSALRSFMSGREAALPIPLDFDVVAFYQLYAPAAAAPSSIDSNTAAPLATLEQVRSCLQQRVPDIEDLVQSLNDGGALPLCMARFATQLGTRGAGYLPNEQRTLYYRLLSSLELPQLSHELLVRHLLRNTPADKFAEHWQDVAIGFQKSLLERAHERAAEGLRRAVPQLTVAQARAQTTCAPSCKTMAAKLDCPHAWSASERQALIDLMVRLGVDAERAALIADHNAQAPAARCRLFMHARHTRSVHDPWPEAMAVAPTHPRDFTRAVQAAMSRAP